MEQRRELKSGEIDLIEYLGSLAKPCVENLA